ncbi:MAG: tetratricopeptide repeat-containing sensor histidine kinase [Bacteroidota bacterium]|nr:tetratricopeptide repeat-containing sensor histidine kinase [Bacteroidota bacterium]
MKSNATKVCIFFHTLLFITIYSNTAFSQGIDTLKINELLQQSKVAIDNDPVKSLDLAQQAYDLSEKSKYEYGKAEALRRIGIYYMFKSDFPNALDNILKSLRIAEKIDDKKTISKCLMNLGGIYYDYGELNLALNYFNKSLKIAKQINDKKSIAGCLTNSANVYTDLGDYKAAIENYKKALNINNELQDKQGQSIALSNIGNVYFYQKQYSAAEKYYQQCLKIKESINDIEGMIICYNNLGNLYMQTNQLNKAIESSSLSLEMARNVKSKDDIHRASLALASVYKKLGDFKTALAYHELATIMKDSIFNDSRNKEIGKLEAKFALEKKEAQIKLLKKDKALEEEKAKQTLLNRNLIIVGIVLISFIVISLVQQRNNRRIRKFNQQLMTQNKEIQAKSEALAIANEELDNFVYRSSHDLKAPLTSVLGLINITKSESTEDGLKLYLVKMQESIDRLMLVLKDLSNYSRNSRLQVTHETIDFNKLITKVLDDLKFLPNYNNVKINYTIEGSGMYISDPLRIHILLNNLISNAITHNDFSKSNPYVNVHITYTETKAIIKIEDNGEGIPDEYHNKIYDMFFKGSNNSQGSGLGLYIVKGVIKKLQGHISFITRSGEGTTFVVEVPTLMYNTEI